MQKLRFILFFLVAFLLVNFLSCKDDYENYSTSPNDILAFSTDTVSFDTILSTVNTPILGFMVYNPGSKPLLISSIGLSNGGQSGFKINVDGVAGTRFENVEIGAEDSLYVFVSVKLEENNQIVPILHNDYVVFITNTVQQRVVLEAYGQDAYVWLGKVFETSETLPNDKPYLVYDSLEIKEGVTLTVQEGTTFYMHSKTRINVKGTLIAKGTQEKRIVIRGDRMDYMVNIPYDRVPGQWRGITFASESFDNELEYVWIRNGEYGLLFERSEPERSKLMIKNSIVTNVTGNLILAENCRIEAENSEFSNSQYALMYLVGGQYSFTHCTMANYYPNSEYFGNSNQPTLILTNKSYEIGEDGKSPVPIALPLLQADFVNSIIYSPNFNSVIQLQRDTTEFPGTVFNYRFQNSLVLYNRTNKDMFPDCVFNEPPKFINTNLTDDDAKSIPYDFRLDSLSPARDIADPLISQKIPYDLNGISRLQDKAPDAGAYEYIPSGQ